MCIYKVHFVHRARILLCILIFQKELFSLLCFALHCCMLSSGPYFVQSAGISRWSAAFPCSDLRIVLAMARFSERHHSAWVSKTICDICDQFCFDFGLKLPQNLWNVFVFVSASVLLKTAIKLGEKGKRRKKLKTGTFPTARQNAMLLDLDLDRLKHQTCNHSFQT